MEQWGLDPAKTNVNGGLAQTQLLGVCDFGKRLVGADASFEWAWRNGTLPESMLARKPCRKVVLSGDRRPKVRGSAPARRNIASGLAESRPRNSERSTGTIDFYLG
jgi:hypothetical protein